MSTHASRLVVPPPVYESANKCRPPKLTVALSQILHPLFRLLSAPNREAPAHPPKKSTLMSLAYGLRRMILVEWIRSSEWQLTPARRLPLFRQPRRSSWKKRPTRWVIAEIGTKEEVLHNAAELRMLSRDFYAESTSVFWDMAVLSIASCWGWHDKNGHGTRCAQRVQPILLVFSSNLQSLEVSYHQLTWLTPRLEASIEEQSRPNLSFGLAPHLKHLYLWASYRYEPCAWYSPPAEFIALLHATKTFQVTITFRVYKGSAHGAVDIGRFVTNDDSLDTFAPDAFRWQWIFDDSVKESDHERLASIADRTIDQFLLRARTNSEQKEKLFRLKFPAALSMAAADALVLLQFAFYNVFISSTPNYIAQIPERRPLESTMLPTMKLFSPEFDGQPASTTRALAGSVRAKLYHVLTQCQSRLASIRGEALNTSPQHRADAVLTLSGAHQVAPPTLTTLPLEIQQQIYQEWFSSISWSIIDANICTAWGRFTYIPPKSRTGKKLLKQRLQQYQPGQPVYIIAETGRSRIPMCNSVELRMVSRAFYNACNPIFFRKVAFDISCRLWDLWAHDHKDLKLPLVLSSRLQYLDLDFEHIELLLPTLVTTTATFTAGYRPELIMALVPNLKHLETRCRGSCSRVSFGYKVTLYGPGDPQVLAFCHARKMFRTTITFLVESNIGFGLCNTV
ncbi:hypothetical protein PMZ80_001427 [Knufia obscura]|nr:hypothetical protein PMZ80_001427 [Knufia obscura]